MVRFWRVHECLRNIFSGGTEGQMLSSSCREFPGTVGDGDGDGDDDDDGDDDGNDDDDG